MSAVAPVPAPVSTYRLQLRREFGFDDAAQIADYLAALGVSHAYLSPVLKATPGSAHGYDVVDHAELSPDAGGRAGFDRLVAALHHNGLRAVADVVPNHMAVPTPERLNAVLWSVLRDGPASEFASWFDVDWAPGALLMPVLGKPLEQVLADGDLVVDGDTLRYFDHEFPLAPGTSGLALPELLAAQHYRLAWWRVSRDQLNYRRFFDVTTLIAVRVEDRPVFDATHALLLELLASGALTGLRIDHPDGLADPRGYLRTLAEASGGAWVVAEKILEDDEELPADWPCAGTTGYDALNRVQGLFVDPAGEAELDALAGIGPGHLERATVAAKTQIVTQVLVPEVERLLTLLTRIAARSHPHADHTPPALAAALRALLVAMDRYRAYVVPGEPAPEPARRVVAEAAERARELLGTDEPAVAALDLVTAVALDTTSGDADTDEFVVRFQQTCGPAMAKGIEDTLFYRWDRLFALNEVGASPARFGYSPAEFHAFAGRLQRDWPDTLTTLSTHDTKRSEDARARLLALSELPSEWAAATATWTDLATPFLPDGAPEPPWALIWQTLLAVWEGGAPDAERVHSYLEKAVREAKLHTTWTEPDERYEGAIRAVVDGLLGDAAFAASIGAFVDRLGPAERATVLGQKLVQLTMPGVPDVYQGCEIVDRSLVDPDNRRPVDYRRRRELLTALDGGTPPADLSAEKLLVTSRALRLRRDHPEWFAMGAAYTPLEPGSPHAVAFERSGSVVTVATRLAARLAASGGFGEAALELPPGDWTDVLTGRAFTGPAPLAELLAGLPVALLVRS